MTLQPVTTAWEQETGVGDDVGGRPGATADQQAGIVGMDMQQLALSCAGLHRFDNVLAFG